MTSSGDEVLIVVATATRRGAELEGTALAEQLTAHGVPAHAVALAPGSNELEIPALGPQPRSLATLGALRRRARHARLVVAYGSSTLPASAIALAGTGVPFIYRSIGDPAAWVRGRTHRCATGLLFRRAAHVVALWPDAAEAIGELYGVGPARRSVVPNARDHLYFSPPSTADRTAARRALAIDHDTTAVVLVGSLTPEKRAGLAAEAVARQPSAQLLIVGDGPERGDLERCATRSDGRIRVVGRVRDVRPILHAADTIVSTSTTEGMPGSLIEAALCGVPAVATDVGAVSEVVAEGGVVVSANASPNEIARAISEATERAEVLGPAARAHAVARFSWETVRPSWLQVLARLGR